MRMNRLRYFTVLIRALVMASFAVPCAVGINSKPDPLINVQREHNEATVIAKEQSLTLLQTILKNMQAEYDPEFGGFGSKEGPKFPRPSALDFLLIYHDQTGDASALDMVQKTLSLMASGGVHDHLGGGFFHHALDGQWRVPRFEKKSYDNAELLRVYLHAYQATGREEFASIARTIIAYTMRELADKQHGGFYTSQGSESSADDDADYYTWTRDEVRAALPTDEARIIEAYYDIQQKGEMKRNTAKNVLFISASPGQLAQQHNLTVQAVEQILDRSKEKLLVTRNQRSSPKVDTSIIVASNSMCISAFLEASIVFDESTLREFALKTLERLIREAYRKGHGMAHTAGTATAFSAGLLYDQILFAQTCLDAYQITADRRYLELARDLTDFCLEKYWEPIVGAFSLHQLDFSTTWFSPLPKRSSNSMAAQMLERLALLTTQEIYHIKAEDIIRVFAGDVRPRGNGSILGSYGAALAMLLHPPPKVAIIGKKNDPRTQTLWQKALATYRPGKVVVVYDPTTEKDLLFPPAKDGSPLVYVCSGEVCYPPVRTVDQMAKVIQKAGRD